MAWKIKRFTNDELRQKFVDVTVPQAHFLGLKMPDPDLGLDEKTGHWNFGEIDWQEFKQVLSGNGPGNAERLGARRSAHDEGSWVRQALLAHADKQRERSSAHEAA